VIHATLAIADSAALLFDETARHLSFNRAAAALCVTQGAVSRQIRMLEDSLGVRLFERDHTGIRLTAAGAQLRPCLAEAFDMIERGCRQVAAQTSTRRLIVSMPPTFATQRFSPQLGALALTLPDVKLSIRTEPTDDCHCAIRFGREALQGAHSELLMIERHALVGARHLAGEPVGALLDRLPALHVLHENTRLNLWPDWLAMAGMPARARPRRRASMTLPLRFTFRNAQISRTHSTKGHAADALGQNVSHRSRRFVVRRPVLSAAHLRQSGDGN
jgi:DNA-binding transcriptional LysR family regulator